MFFSKLLTHLTDFYTCSFGFLDSSPKTSEEIESSKGHPKATDRSTIYSNPKSIQIQTRPKNKKPPPKSHQNHPPQALCRLHPTHLHRWGGPLQERRTGTQRSRERPAGTRGWGVGDEHNVAGLSEFHPKLFQGEKKMEKTEDVERIINRIHAIDWNHWVKQRVFWINVYVYVHLQPSGPM